MNPAIAPTVLRLHDDLQWTILIANDIPPVGAEWESGRCYLHFEDSPKARALLGDLAAEVLRENPRTLIAAFKTGRRFLRDEVDKRGGR